ncbi:hypothetical protein SAMN04489729_2794 [Amycolatopsis lurida]|uniref:hypothetical protein n=1 Tax=Amycolatopsis lurida TaxID=31959 RepID=UPI000896EC4C|nr:hypothetical protein [Amycolatopsis lurida]SEC91563.1 hypothetical protein SAMN04489729_2794 [Amycolatopsis lurida]
MRRWVVAAMEQGCRLISPEEGAVPHKGDSYRFEAVGCSPNVRGRLSHTVLVEVAMSRDVGTDEQGD